MEWYIFCILIGILLYLFVNNIDRFSIGIPFIGGPGDDAIYVCSKSLGRWSAGYIDRLIFEDGREKIKVAYNNDTSQKTISRRSEGTDWIWISDLEYYRDACPGPMCAAGGGRAHGGRAHGGGRAAGGGLGSLGGARGGGRGARGGGMARQLPPNKLMWEQLSSEQKAALRKIGFTGVNWDDINYNHDDYTFNKNLSQAQIDELSHLGFEISWINLFYVNSDRRPLILTSSDASSEIAGNIMQTNPKLNPVDALKFYEPFSDAIKFTLTNLHSHSQKPLYYTASRFYLTICQLLRNNSELILTLGSHSGNSGRSPDGNSDVSYGVLACSLNLGNTAFSESATDFYFNTHHVAAKEARYRRRNPNYIVEKMIEYVDNPIWNDDIPIIYEMLEDIMMTRTMIILREKIKDDPRIYHDRNRMFACGPFGCSVAGAGPNWLPKCEGWRSDLESSGSIQTTDIVDPAVILTENAKIYDWTTDQITRNGINIDNNNWKQVRIKYNHELWDTHIFFSEDQQDAVNRLKIILSGTGAGAGGGAGGRGGGGRGGGGRGRCQDLPARDGSDWVDGSNNGCSAYEAGEAAGHNWCSRHGGSTFVGRGNANTHCCICSGGVGGASGGGAGAGGGAEMPPGGLH
jgi:hypothetical protein